METIKKVPEIVYLTVQVVSPAHAYDFFEDTRMPHSQVYGMVCAHTATRNLKIVPVVFFTHYRDHLIQDIPLVLQMTPDTVGRMYVLIIEAFSVNTVNAEQLQITIIYLILQSPYNAPVLIIVKSCHAGREEEYRPAVVPEDQKFHVAAQRGAVPFVIFPVH
jgi:hypothetical protein